MGSVKQIQPQKPAINGPIVGVDIISDVIKDAYKYIEERYFSANKIIGIETGFKALDEMLCGLQKSDLIIIAGRPAMGKTSLAMSIAYNAASIHKEPVAIFSLEMSKMQLALRLLSSESMIDQQLLKKGALEPSDLTKLVYAAQQISRLPLYISDSTNVSVEQILNTARKIQSENGLSLIVIDYLQLLTIGGYRTENRQQEVAKISQALKAMAKELDVPVVALSQLSRTVEGRLDKRPILSDLRESGNLEADADVVLLLYRDEYYKPDSDNVGIAEVIVAKHRNGPTGVIELTFLKEFAKFS